MNGTDIQKALCSKCKGLIHRHFSKLLGWSPWSHDFFADFMKCGIALPAEEPQGELANAE